MICPKCGRPVQKEAVICPGCDFILDTNFLGTEILDHDSELRPGKGGVSPENFNLADAVILGDADKNSQIFESNDSGFHKEDRSGASFFVSGQSQAMLSPDAIPAIIEKNTSHVKLTPFEKHVLSYITGSLPVEEIRIKAGLEESEVKTALATLTDKGVIKVVGRTLGFLEEEEDLNKPANSLHRLPSGLLPIAGIYDEADMEIRQAFQSQIISIDQLKEDDQNFIRQLQAKNRQNPNFDPKTREYQSLQQSSIAAAASQAEKNHQKSRAVLTQQSAEASLQTSTRNIRYGEERIFSSEHSSILTSTAIHKSSQKKALHFYNKALQQRKQKAYSVAAMNMQLATIYAPKNTDYKKEFDELNQLLGHDKNKLKNSEEKVIYDEVQRLEKEKDFDAAIQMLRRGIQLNANVAAYYNRLGVLLAIHKRRFKESLEQIKKAIKIDPDNMHYKNNLGKIQKKLIEQKEATY